jgi:ATP-binding cassette, subfamily D (ALD), peroxisomal long-chain fatty acid import protein
MWGLTLNYFVTASILRALTPPFGKLAAQEAKLEGDFRSAHSRLITNAEEIGFYNGEVFACYSGTGKVDFAKDILKAHQAHQPHLSYKDCIQHVRGTLDLIQDFIIKYSWSAVGLMLASIPVFFPDAAGSRTKREEAALDLEQGTTIPDSLLDKKAGSRTQGFITNKRLMLSLADAGGRFMYSYKELSELAGYTYRVYNMLRVFEDLRRNKFLQTNVNPSYSLEHIDGKLTFNENRKFV